MKEPGAQGSAAPEGSAADGPYVDRAKGPSTASASPSSPPTSSTPTVQSASLSTPSTRSTTGKERLVGGRTAGVDDDQAQVEQRREVVDRPLAALARTELDRAGVHAPPPQLTGMRRGRALAGLGSRTVRTPSSMEADTPSSSISPGTTTS